MSGRGLLPGTRVRVTYEGVVSQLGSSTTTFVDPKDGSGLRTVGDADAVEVIAPPPREFEDGAYYLDPASGTVYKYIAGWGTFRLAEGTGAYPLRSVRDDLIKLVPEVMS